MSYWVDRAWTAYCPRCIHLEEGDNPYQRDSESCKTCKPLEPTNFLEGKS
jgi:hypothetical protein